MSRAKRQMTDDEALPIAERCADWLLRPENAILRVAIVKGFENPKAVYKIFKGFGLKTKVLDSKEGQGLADAVEQGDRSALVKVLMKSVPFWNDTGDDANWKLLENMTSDFRSTLEAATKSIRLKTGPRSKLRPGDLAKLAQFSDRLSPLIVILLQEREAKTKRSIQEILEYRTADFPSESAFLLGNIARLESILKDKDLLDRAKKLHTRARLIADAMAAATFDLKPRTSLERSREGRRINRKKPS